MDNSISRIETTFNMVPDNTSDTVHDAGKGAQQPQSAPDAMEKSGALSSEELAKLQKLLGKKVFRQSDTKTESATIPFQEIGFNREAIPPTFKEAYDAFRKEIEAIEINYPNRTSAVANYVLNKNTAFVKSPRNAFSIIQGLLGPAPINQKTIMQVIMTFRQLPVKQQTKIVRKISMQFINSSLAKPMSKNIQKAVSRNPSAYAMQSLSYKALPALIQSFLLFVPPLTVAEQVMDKKLQKAVEQHNKSARVFPQEMESFLHTIHASEALKSGTDEPTTNDEAAPEAQETPDKKSFFEKNQESHKVRGFIKQHMLGLTAEQFVQLAKETEWPRFKDREILEYVKINTKTLYPDQVIALSDLAINSSHKDRILIIFAEANAQYFPAEEIQKLAEACSNPKNKDRINKLLTK